MRVYEYARKIGVESSDVLEEAAALNIEASSASSGLSDEEIKTLDLSFAENGHTGPKPVPKEDAKTPETPPSPEPKKTASEKKKTKKRTTKARVAGTSGKRSRNHPALRLP